MLKQFQAAPKALGANASARHRTTLYFEPVKRWDLLSLVRNLRQELGLSRGDIEAFQVLLSFLPCKDGRTGNDRPVDANMLLVVYAGNQAILGRTNGMSERALRSHIRSLVRAGLVVRKESSNGKRFPLRRNSEVVDAFGLDLTPAFLSYGRLAEIDREMRTMREAARSLRSEILARRKHLLASVSRLRDDACAWLISLSRVLRRSLELTELEQIAGSLAAIEADITSSSDADQDHIDATLQVPISPAPPSGETITHDGGDGQRDSSTSLDETVIASDTDDIPDPVTSPESTGTDGDSCRHIESKKIRLHRRACGKNEVSIFTLWRECPHIAEYYPSPPQTPREMAGTLGLVGSFLGIREAQITDALRVLGLFETARKLDYLIRHFDVIDNPGGYLKAIIQRCLPCRHPERVGFA